MSSFSSPIRRSKGGARAKSGTPFLKGMVPHQRLTGQRGFSPGRVSNVIPSALLIQPKLTVGAPFDKYEQEADRFADQVLRMSEPPAGKPAVQRLCSEREEKMHRQPAEEKEEEELLQAKEAIGQTSELTPEMASEIASLQGGGQPLPASEREFFEPRFGHDFSRVRVHSDTRAAESARAINARAYTAGRNVVFGAGEYAPSTTEGQLLLAHELTHVVQQTGIWAAPPDATILAHAGATNAAPLFLIQRQGGSVCTQSRTQAINAALTRATAWRDKALSWLDFYKQRAELIKENRDRLYMSSGILKGFHTMLTRLDTHFNIRQFLKDDRKAFPEDASEIRPEHIGAYLEAVKPVRDRLAGMSFHLTFQCDPACPSIDEGGYAVAGSNEFTICENVFDCQESDGKNCIVFHEAFHANFSDADSDIYITDKKYPGKHRIATRNADTYANFASDVNTQQICSFTICF